MNQAVRPFVGLLLFCNRYFSVGFYFLSTHSMQVGQSGSSYEDTLNQSSFVCISVPTDPPSEEGPLFIEVIVPKVVRDTL